MIEAANRPNGPAARMPAIAEWIWSSFWRVFGDFSLMIWLYGAE